MIWPTGNILNERTRLSVLERVAATAAAGPLADPPAARPADALAAQAA